MDRWIRILDAALLALHFLSIISERQKAKDFQKHLNEVDDIPKELVKAAEVYSSFLGYVSFALLAIHSAVI